MSENALRLGQSKHYLFKYEGSGEVMSFINPMQDGISL
jgi:hypothetical protein